MKGIDQKRWSKSSAQKGAMRGVVVGDLLFDQIALAAALSAFTKSQRIVYGEDDVESALQAIAGTILLR